jgi:hypothetical protein
LVPDVSNVPPLRSVPNVLNPKDYDGGELARLTILKTSNEQ